MYECTQSTHILSYFIIEYKYDRTFSANDYEYWIPQLYNMFVYMLDVVPIFRQIHSQPCNIFLFQYDWKGIETLK